MKIVWQTPDGGIIVTTPLGPRLSTNESEESYLDRIAAKAANIPGGSIRLPNVADDALPADRTFRNAWCWSDEAIGHDMSKAREIHKETLRRVRAPLLAQADIDYVRADESGDAAQKAAIASRKQALRDVTADPAIEVASTPEELKAVWPAALGERALAKAGRPAK